MWTQKETPQMYEESGQTFSVNCHLSAHTYVLSAPIILLSAVDVYEDILRDYE